MCVGKKYLSGCQCGILSLWLKIMRAADFKPFGRKIEDFSPVISRRTMATTRGMPAGSVVISRSPKPTERISRSTSSAWPIPTSKTASPCAQSFPPQGGDGAIKIQPILAAVQGAVGSKSFTETSSPGISPKGMWADCREYNHRFPAAGAAPSWRPPAWAPPGL